MPIKLGPITHMEINGQDVTHCVSGISFTGIDASASPSPACDWDTLVDAYNQVVADVLEEPAPGSSRVIDQDGNPVRPPQGRMRDLGRC